MKKILVIEDDSETRRNIVSILRLEGYHPIVAECGRDGIALAKHEKPELILCDVMMRDLDGYAVLQTLRLLPSSASIPFIFLTAKGEKEDVRSGMNFGADDYLIKPFLKSELLKAIKARLQRATQQIKREFKPDFSSYEPLLTLGLRPRAAEVLLWLAQGKTNADIAGILNIAEATVKKHVLEIFEKLSVETRSAATLRALEVLCSPAT